MSNTTPGHHFLARACELKTNMKPNAMTLNHRVPGSSPGASDVLNTASTPQNTKTFGRPGADRGNKLPRLAKNDLSDLPDQDLLDLIYTLGREVGLAPVKTIEASLTSVSAPGVGGPLIDDRN